MATREELIEQIQRQELMAQIQAQESASDSNASVQAASDTYKSNQSPVDPTSPTGESSDYSFTEDTLRPWWDDLNVKEDVVKPVGHVVKGIPKGLAEVGDMPNMYSQAKRWGLEKLTNEEELAGIDERVGPYKSFPKLTTALEGNPVYDALAGESYEQGEAPGWAEAGRVGAEWGSAGPINAVRKGALKAATSDIAQAGAATIGNILDQSIKKFTGDEEQGVKGELSLGLISTLMSLRKGDFSKLSKDDRIAWDFLVENIEEGRSVDDLTTEVEKRLASGEVGSLAEIARDRGIQDVQSAISDNSAYSRELQGLTESRDAQILDSTSDQFAPFTETTIPAGQDAGRRASLSEADRVMEAANVRAADAGVPLKVEAADDAWLAQEIAGDRLNKATAEADRVAGTLPPLRASNFDNTIPESQVETVFEGVDRTQPEEMYALEKNFWDGSEAFEGSPKAFEEVRNYDEGFQLSEEFVDGLETQLNNPDVATSLKDYMQDALRRIASNKGMPAPKFGAKGFDEAAFLDEISTGTIDGDQIIALRNYFASNANTSNNFINAGANRDIANAIDDVIVDTLPTDMGTQFIETKGAYPSHLANRELMENSKTTLAYDPLNPETFGTYTPGDQIRAGQRQGFPNNKQENRVANRDIEMSKSGLEKATAEASAADTAVLAAQKAVKVAQEKADKAINAGTVKAEGLYKANLKNFEDDPIKTIQGLLSSRSGKATDEIKSLKKMMEEAGSGDEFNALVGESIVRSLNDSKSGSRASVLPKAVKNMEGYINRLINSGIITDQAQADRLAEIVEKAAVKEYLANGRSTKMGGARLSEMENLGSSVAAAMLLRTFAKGSSSLIVAGALKRAVSTALHGTAYKSAETAVPFLRKLTTDPQRFLDAAKTAKSEDEAVRMMLTEMVGATQAAELLEE
jgi:hypothetical protein